MTTDCANLRELLAKATPGEWLTYETPSLEKDRPRRKFWYGVSAAGFDVADCALSYPPRVHEKANAELIVALQNAAPALLDELEALRIRGEELCTANIAATKMAVDSRTDNERLREEITATMVARDRAQSLLEEKGMEVELLLADRDSWKQQAMIQAESLRLSNLEVERLLEANTWLNLRVVQLENEELSRRIAIKDQQEKG